MVPWLLAAAMLSPSEAVPIKAMSFNVRFSTANDGEFSWPHRKERLFALLRREDADIVGLQEALRPQISQIRAATTRYAEVGLGRDDGAAKGEHCTILFRSDRFAVTSSGTFWLSDTPEKVASTTWGNGITRICTWVRLLETSSQRVLWVFNAHLDHQSQPSRERSVGLLRDRIAHQVGKEPFLVLGDFNAGERNPAVRAMLHPIAGVSSVRDTFRAVHPDRRDVRTFNGWSDDRAGDKIDYVFVSDAWRILDAAILYPGGPRLFESDHYPVTASLELP